MFNLIGGIMILLKIDNNQELEWNQNEIQSLADAYDHGCKSEMTRTAKLLTLIYEKGRESVLDAIHFEQQQAMLLFSSPMGNA